MENEINLKEIFGVLWRGKFIVVAVTGLLTLAALFYVLYLAAPTYQYSALLDLTAHEIESKKVQALIDQNGVIAKAVNNLSVEPGAISPAASVKFLNDKEAVMQIAVKYPDPDVCKNAVEQVGLGIISTVSEFLLEQTGLQIDRHEKLLAGLEKTVAEYLQSRDTGITDILEEDPVYKRLLLEKGEYMVTLEELNLNLAEFGQSPTGDAVTWAGSLEGTARPVSINKKLYVATAILFGLMLSILIIFIRHYFLINSPAMRGRLEKDC